MLSLARLVDNLDDFLIPYGHNNPAIVEYVEAMIAA